MYVGPHDGNSTRCCERMGGLVRWVIEDIRQALFMFSPKFSDEGEISGRIEGQLDLEDEIR